MAVNFRYPLKSGWTGQPMKVWMPKVTSISSVRNKTYINALSLIKNFIVKTACLKCLFYQYPIGCQDFWLHTISDVTIYILYTCVYGGVVH